MIQKCYTMQMPTQKKRINITIDDATYAAIERLADARLKKKQCRVPHDEAWD